jgi:hypothetical protein
MLLLGKKAAEQGSAKKGTRGVITRRAVNKNPLERK